MKTVDATQLKNRLGEVLKQAALGPVAVERHGRVVAYLVPPAAGKAHAGKTRTGRPGPRWNRRNEERVVELCARGDYRPSRWLRAGDPEVLAGVAAMLASQEGFDRTRMLALAEQLRPGMSTPVGFGRWLARSPVQAARFLPMLEARMRDPELRSP
ncbi:MAG: type II toxin-antitoxin system Phd/YefM family antitoxin [Betaproteobacteria bacterium]|nr:type II toxin-antitoxin system Phd/YefM family antitoxin [Betaproteobacteria bacterium]